MLSSVEVLVDQIDNLVSIVSESRRVFRKVLISFVDFFKKFFQFFFFFDLLDKVMYELGSSLHYLFELYKIAGSFGRVMF